ncbi:MAG: hypothetical protein IT289_07795 [Oligoflexia bacterium]|nr:hypothetical protein [Oligoflexia bacterium]
MGTRRKILLTVLLATLGCGNHSSPFKAVSTSNIQSQPSIGVTPAPTVTTTPTPAPSATPGPFVCPLPSSRDNECRKEARSEYFDAVEQSIFQLIQERPELFDFNDIKPNTEYCYKVRDIGAYTAGVVLRLGQRGYCAIDDQGEEVAVKKDTNSFNEQFDIILWDGYIRCGRGMYVSTCYPSAF